MKNKEFLSKLANEKLKNVDKAIGFIWFFDGEKRNGITARQICDEFENAGYGKQNQTLLKRSLEKDQRTCKKSKDTFIIKEKYFEQITKQFNSYLNCVEIKTSDSIIPKILFKSSKGYIIKVVDQLNASYELSLFDCCAVMCRRLLETLIIEVYESHNRATEIKDNDGNFFMFSGLLNTIQNDASINISRNTKKGLAEFKTLGDLSAHNRRFNARKNDIDRIRDGMRVASEELLNLT